MDGAGRAYDSQGKGTERSFAGEVRKLQLGTGETFHGEAILAVTKGLLQAGVSYVGGYPGAPVSHLIDVLSDARANHRAILRDVEQAQFEVFQDRTIINARAIKGP